MNISFSSLTATERYHVMTQVIIPRPIAWVLSANHNATEARTPSSNETKASVSYNLAPFSYFNAISSDPALVMLSIGSKPNGSLKDTRRNIVEGKHCVIHIPSDDQAPALTASAETLDYGDSEVEKLNVKLVEQEGWPLPRLGESRLAMACRLYDYQEIGANKQGLIFCQIEEVFVDDSCLNEDGKGRIKISAEKVAPLARLGASEYASFGQVLSVARPK